MFFLLVFLPPLSHSSFIPIMLFYFLFSSHPPLSSPIIFSFFIIRPHLSHSIILPRYPMLSSVVLYSYPSSLIYCLSLYPVMLSSLPFYPPCLISSHFPLMLSSISPFVGLVNLLTGRHRHFCLNSAQNATFSTSARMHQHT